MWNDERATYAPLPVLLRRRSFGVDDSIALASPVVWGADAPVAYFFDLSAICARAAERD